MAGGRKPIPDELKLIRSNKPRKDSMNPNKPVYGDQVQVPAHFDKRRKDEWFEIVPLLIKAGVATEIDVVALEHLVEMRVKWREAVDLVNGDSDDGGMVKKAASGHAQVNPYFTIQQQLAKSISSMLAEFGMTPSSRQKVVATKEVSKAKSEFSDIT